jgi:hypothetical protein
MTPLGEVMATALGIIILLTGVEYLRRRYILWKRSQSE